MRVTSPHSPSVQVALAPIVNGVDVAIATFLVNLPVPSGNCQVHDNPWPQGRARKPN